MTDIKKKNKKKKNKGKYLGLIIYIGLGGLLGFSLGFLSEGILKGFVAEYIYAENWYMEAFNHLKFIAILILTYLVQIIVHEGGHLIFGLLSGYSFVSFRVGSLTLIKESGKFKLKRFNIPGTAGQCLMMPPAIENGQYPFIIYNLGGGLLNFIVSGISILIAINIQDLNYIKIILVLFSISGILAGLTNIIPLKIGGISNDGHNIMTMIKDKSCRESFYLQLRVNGLQSRGSRIKDMPYKFFRLDRDIDYKNPLNFSRILLNHNYHLDSMDFVKAREALEFGQEHADKTILIYKMELAAELMFLELLGDFDRKRIEELYDKNLKKYIKASKFMIGKKRIMMAYEAFYKDDRGEALKHYKDLKDLAKKYPNKGEADMELMLGDYLREKME